MFLALFNCVKTEISLLVLDVYDPTHVMIGQMLYGVRSTVWPTGSPQERIGHALGTILCFAFTQPELVASSLTG